MGKWFDRIFRTEYYDAVISDYTKAKKEYCKGLAAFEEEKDGPYDQYEYQKFIHENIEKIRGYEGIIKAADAIRNCYPTGLAEFMSRNSFCSSIECSRQIVSHQNEIKEFETVLTGFEKLYRQYADAVKLFVGTNPTYKSKRQLVTVNSDKVRKVDKYFKTYLTLKYQYPRAVEAFIPKSPTLKNITEFAETAKQDTIPIVEEYLQVKNSYTTNSFKELIGNQYAPAATDYSASAITSMKKIINLHKAELKKLEERRHINQIKKNYAKPIALRFGKRADELTAAEEKQLLNMDDLEEVQDTYFSGDLEEYDWHNLNYLVEWAEEHGTVVKLPQNLDDFLNYGRLNILLSQYSSNRDLLDHIFPDSPQFYDFSPSACAYRRSMIAFLSSQYGKRYEGYGFMMTATRDEVLRELFSFPSYGKDKQVNFDESFSIKESFELERSIEECDTDFKTCYNYIKDNLNALKQYNKERTGKDTWYINDLLKIAKKDKNLFDYVDGKNQEEKIRDNVRAIMRSYDLGFAKYKQTNLYNFDINTASVATLQRIIGQKSNISNLHTIAKAEEIVKNYPDAILKRFGKISTYSGISYDTAKRICDIEYTLRSDQQCYDEKKAFARRIQQATANWSSVAGIPLYFFYWYYPTRFTNISPESQEVRKMVYNFKDGRAHSKVADMVQRKLRSTFSESDIRTFTFVCIPASTVIGNITRYQSFSNDVCNALGMSNAFQHIKITKEKTASHLGGSDSAEYSYDSSFFQDAKVVLFDDIVTRGGSMSYFKYALEELGATIVCAMSIGRTYSDWNGHTPEPHPWTGRP